jgi:hypothetical protein
VLVRLGLHRCHWSHISVHQHPTKLVHGLIVSLLCSLLLILAKQHRDRTAHTWTITSATKLCLVLIGVRGTGSCHPDIAHPLIAVVDPVDAPLGRGGDVWWVGSQQCSPQFGLINKIGGYQCSKASWKRVRRFTSNRTHSAHIVLREPWNLKLVFGAGPNIEA